MKRRHAIEFVCGPWWTLRFLWGLMRTEKPIEEKRTVKKKAGIIVILAAVVVALVAVDSFRTISPDLVALARVEERELGRLIDKSRALKTVNPIAVLLKRDADLFEARYTDATSPEFGRLVENGRLIKQLVDNETAAIEKLHDFTLTRMDTPGAMSTWDARGYRFLYLSDGDFWSVTAYPLTQYRTGVRWFYVDETNVFRVALEGPATSTSPVLGDHQNWTCDAATVKRVLEWGPL